MKLPAAKIESAASQEKSRYVLQAIKFDAAGKRLVATDGNIAAIVPVEVAEGDNSGLLSLDAMKQLRGLQKMAKSVPVNVSVNGKVSAEFGDVKQEFELTPGRFPNVDAAIPKDDRPMTVSLDVDLLLRLADALKSKAQGKRILKLYVKDNNSAVLVKVDGEESYGAIMPCRVG